MKRLIASFAVLCNVWAVVADEVVWEGDVTITKDTIATCTDHSKLTSLKIEAGATVYFQTATAPDCTITGTGTLVKDIVDAWTPTNPITGFTGDYRIAKGIAYAGTVRHAFGDDNGDTTKLSVEKGASLVLTQWTENIFWKSKIHLAGEGALDTDGVTRLGALRVPGVTTTASNLLNNLYLDDDATIYAPKDGLWFINGCLKTNGHKLTFTGAGTPTIFTKNVPSDGGEIIVKYAGSGRETRLTLRSWNASNPDTGIPAGDSPFVMTGNSMIQIYTGFQPVYRPLWLTGTNTLSLAANTSPKQSYETNSANWAGPVVFTNETESSLLKFVNDTGDDRGRRLFVISGPISGNGSLFLSQGTSNQRIGLLGKGSTYTGYTYFENNYGADTLLGYPSSVPVENYSSVTTRAGYVDLAVGDSYDRWTLEDAYKFRTQATFNGGSQIRFSSEFTTNGCGSVKAAFATTNGANIVLGSRDNVKFEGSGNETPWNFNWFWGKATLTGPQPILLGTSKLDFYSSAPSNSEVRVENADVTVDYSGDILLGSTKNLRTSHLVVSNSLIRCSDVMKVNHGSAWKNIRGGTLTVGWRSHGTLEVLPGTIISNRLVVGSFSNDGCWTCGGMGAVYQRGGKVVSLGGDTTHLSPGLGMGQYSSHGYYELTDGLFEGRGKFNIGGYGVGVFAQYGGTALITNRLDEAASPELILAGCNGGQSVMYLRGGSFAVRPARDVWVGKSDNVTQSEVTFDGPDVSFDIGENRFYLGYGNQGGYYAFNFNAGICHCGGIELHSNKSHETTRYDVSFNGGTFKVGGWSNLFGSTINDVAKRVQFGARNVVVYKGGMTIDTDGNDCYIASCIRKPTGYGIKAIKLGSPLANDSYIGSPRVLIDASDCGGASATAFAHYDSTNRCVDAVRVTSPGEYSAQDVTARLNYKCGTYPTTIATLTSAAGDIEFEENDQTGSFTKLGAGSLALTVSNDWGGATYVAGGTLKLSATNAIPVGTSVRITNGAILDFNSQVATVGSLAYGPGGGRIQNAGNAVLPSVQSLETTFDDILAGRAIALTGDVEGAQTTLTISGSFSGVAAQEFYPIATTTGRFVGSPTIEMPELPSPWRVVVRSSRIELAKRRGFHLIIR